MCPMTELRATRSDGGSLAGALAGNEAMLDAARDGVARMSAAVVTERAVALGARQVAGRVLDLDACAREGVAVLRRSTTGAAAYVGGSAIVWALALPRVNALVADATLATLLNRNLRLWLKGLVGAGAQAAYFGREWIAVQHRAAVAIGYEVTRDGRVLIEGVAGWDTSIALPPSITAAEERAVDRWRSRPAVALSGCVRAGSSAATLAERVVEVTAERAGVALVWEPTRALRDLDAVTRADDPMPAGYTLREPVRAAIGYVEGAVGDGGPWLGGDVLAPTWWLDDAARALAEGREVPEGGVLEGARVDDLMRALGV